MTKNIEKRKIILIVFCILVFVLLCGFYYIKNIYPNQLMNFGKKYLEMKKYEKALKIFKYIESIKRDDEDALYYEVLTLAKMPPIYENQKRLYEVSQYDFCDEASKLSNNVITEFLKQIYIQAGENYIDNVMFDNKILRWNNNFPIRYSIEKNNFVNDNYISIVSKAFKEWQSTTNSEYKFKKNDINPNIIIHFVNELPDNNISNAVTIPSVKGDILSRMDIYIKNGEYSEDKLFSILLHEIGHALGLGSHSINKNDVMYFDNKNTKISPRDLNTLTILYKTMPDAINIKLEDKIATNLLYSNIITMYIGENYTNEINRIVKQYSPDEMFEKAVFFAKHKQYNRANYILETILPVYNDKFVIYYNLALNNYRMKKYRSSLKNLKLAEKIKINDETKILRAYLLIKASSLKEAEKILLVLYKENPKNNEIGLKLAQIYLKKGKKREYSRIIKKLKY